MRLMMLDARQDFRSSWISALESDGFRVSLFPRLAEGERELRRSNYEALLVNAELPDGDGVDWLRDRRTSDLRTVFVVMTPVHDLETRIRALNAGADDATIDSLQPRELVARLHALLRRQPIIRPTAIEAGNLTLNVMTRKIYVAGTLVSLRRRELGILEHLMLSFNRIVTRPYLEASICGASGEVCPNSIEVRISRLRGWLSRAGADVEVKTLRGLGYRLERKGKTKAGWAPEGMKCGPLAEQYQRE